MIIANLFGSLFFMFFLWKRLKEDYHFERIFNLGVYVLSGVLIGAVISLRYFGNYWFWICLAMVLVTYLIGRYRQKIRFFESFESVIAGFIPWLGLIFISDSVMNASLSSFLAFWVMLCLLVLFFFIDSKYRRVSWYRSGKVGIAGVLTGFLFFVVRAGFSVTGYSAISFAPMLEPVISGLTAFVFVILLYKLNTD